MFKHTFTQQEFSKLTNRIIRDEKCKVNIQNVQATKQVNPYVFVNSTVKHCEFISNGIQFHIHGGYINIEFYTSIDKLHFESSIQFDNEDKNFKCLVGFENVLIQYYIDPDRFMHLLNTLDKPNERECFETQIRRKDPNSLLPENFWMNFDD